MRGLISDSTGNGRSVFMKKLFGNAGTGADHQAQRHCSHCNMGSIDRNFSRLDVNEKKEVGGISYRARRFGRSFSDSLAFEPAKRPDDRVEYCLGCSFFPSAMTRYSFLL